MASEIGVLDPVSESVKIAGREFTQRPLGLRGTAKLLDVLATTMADTGGFELFQQIGDVDVSDPASIDVDKIFPALIQIVRTIPEALPKLLAVALRGDAGDEEFLAEEASPSDALKVIKTFIVQNDIPQLIKDFTEVTSLFSQTVAKVTSPSEAESVS